MFVVGGGPSGLFAAAELARHGVRVRIVEREPHPHHQARATAVQPATLEILQQAGLLDRVLESSMHLEWRRPQRRISLQPAARGADLPQIIARPG